MLRESSRKGAKRRESGMACRAVLGFAVAWYSRCLGPGFAPLRLGARSFDAAGKLTQRRKSARSRYGLPSHLGIRSGLV